jgi:hypothetical protein
MVANPQGSIITPWFLSRNPGFFWWCEPAPNPAGRRNWRLGTSAGSREPHTATKILVDVGIDPFASDN